MEKTFLVISFLLNMVWANAQELYPNSEPASIIPKHALGIRLMNEAYTTSGNFKSWHGAMFMYGVSSKLMFSGTITTSNHHYNKLPINYIVKDSNQTEIVSPNSFNKNNYLFESVNLGFRYRFLNIDGDHKHFRMSVYSNGVYAIQPHDEAEVSLMGDNKGIGAGLISTVLIKKLAVSFTGGIIKPFAYQEKANNTIIKYGNAYNYSLSFGYLVYPFKYTNFNQTNINLYAEFLGKSYDALTIEKDKNKVLSQNTGYSKGNYIEFRPAIQFIIKSNLRIDCSTAIPIVNRSYIRNYPLFLLNIQYYFFR